MHDVISVRTAFSIGVGKFSSAFRVGPAFSVRAGVLLPLFPLLDFLAMGSVGTADDGTEAIKRSKDFSFVMQRCSVHLHPDELMDLFKKPKLTNRRGAGILGVISFTQG